MISNNNKGNPNHDENGRFTSGDNASHGKIQKPINDKEVKYNADVRQKLAAMGFGPSKNEQLRAELEKGDYVNIDNGLSLDDFDMVDYGPEYSGYEDLAIDARKNSDGEYEVYFYREDENGPLEGEYPEDNDPTYVFNSFEELQAFIDNGYKEVEKSENNDGNGSSEEKPKSSKQLGEEYKKAVEDWEHKGGSFAKAERIYDEWKKAMKKEGKEPFYKD